MVAGTDGRSQTTALGSERLRPCCDDGGATALPYLERAATVELTRPF